MTVDLEEEQDPPSFKAARKKDKERLAKVRLFYQISYKRCFLIRLFQLIEEEVDSISELQKEIEEELAKASKPKASKWSIIILSMCPILRIT